ncbi:class I adenylate-forming enzyme family protein [Pseudarthrobacter raffinosi]|uniref:class I adenylate-forming enzyme family protein n=1 Tax=Pseudarthrobacter raffinosi TaxID=2953651 RepID=UPI00208E8BCC|nr:AMP-binding protein [Pseudarthrobacter sp. MDT3-9]MCO4253229.1 AMP-binding protein [Pseudarthrobacter sp. MDT3-9]
MPSLSDILRATAARNPSRPALIFEGRVQTYHQLAARVERMAAVIAEKGVTKGDRVLLVSGNSDSFVVAAYAILRTGAILVPANPRSAPPEMTYLIEDSGASLVIAAPALADLAEAGAASTSTIVMTLGPAAGLEDLTAAAETSTLAPLADWPAESDDAMLIYTSGTTGRPKGALFDHHRSIWVGINMSAVWGMREEENMLHVAPLYHAAELCLMLFPGTMTASTHTILPAFDPAVVAQAMSDQKISVFFGVPTMYQALLRVENLASLDLTQWRVGMFGAAPMPASVVGQLIESLPSVNLYQLCGQTEGGPGGIYSGPADVRARPDASGRFALPNTEFRVIDAYGDDVPAGEVGEIVLRGETIMKRYWNKPDATEAVLHDGWLHTGDIARIDEQGYITLVDRLKDMIISGGRNIYSVEVENALMAHPDIMDAAVLGVPHPEFGESVLAVIVPREGTNPTLEELRVWSMTQIADYKAPRQLIVHNIPRNPSGKILKHVLRAELESVGIGR